MDPKSAAEMLLKLGSLSGLLSLTLQGVRAWTEARDRLQVTTTRYPGGNLLATIEYRPRQRHVGFKALVTALEPAGAAVAGLQHEVQTPAARLSIENAIRQLSAEPTTELRLIGNGAAEPTGSRFRGDVFVGIPAQPDPAAKICIEIWTTGFARRVARRAFRLSAID